MNLGLWSDLTQGFSAGAGKTAFSSDPLTNNASGFFANHDGFMAHNANDQGTWIFQRHHGWIPGDPIYWHIHYYACVNPLVTSNVRLQIGYTFFSDNVVIPDMGADFAGWGGTSNIDIPIGTTDAMVYKYKNGLTLTPPSTVNPSDMFCICMRRHSSDAADTYKTNKGWGTIAANFCLISMDLHFRGNRFGTITQYK